MVIWLYIYMLVIVYTCIHTYIHIFILYIAMNSKYQYNQQYDIGNVGKLEISIVTPYGNH